MGDAVRSANAAHPLLGPPVTRIVRRIPRALLLVLTLMLSVLFAFPLVWTLSSSLKDISEMFIFPPTLLPTVPRWRNYLLVARDVPFGLWFMNTVRVVVLATAGTVISASLVAYSFARFKYRGRDIIFMITLSTMMLPAQVTLIPQFILFHKFGWINTIRPLWVPAWFGGGAFNIFMMRQFIMSLPRELDEAALIDGSSRWRIFWRIIVPLCKPALATLMVISFMRNWSNFMGPLIYLNTPKKFTLSVGLQYFSDVEDGNYEPMYQLLMAACVLTLVPCLVVFFSAQRLFVRGIAMTGIKG